MALANLKRADSICLKIALVASIVVAFTGAMELINQLQMGYVIMLLLIVITIVRTIIFYVMDTKGVQSMALITKIKAFREQTGMKQSELAEMVGSRRETIVHLENGKYNPSLKLAMDIAKVFGVTVEEMFEFVDDEEK